MSQNAFIFNINRCVGCMACVAGCSIENGTTPALNWRKVNSFNKIRHPDLPVFHFSLACNHCEKALCMINCPASAYSRDENTGAIIHHAEACIGCKYCTWACPYDAPKFNMDTGIVEKCNFCVERLHDGKKPACTEECPIGALDFGTEAKPSDEILVPGFVNKRLRPAIRLIKLRKETSKPEIWNMDHEAVSRAETLKWTPSAVSKVKLSKEWVLVAFTLMVAALAGWYGSQLITGSIVPWPIFLTTGFIALILSSLHLGKKWRAWRSILHLSSSWLSREILFFSLFLGLGLFGLLLDIQTIIDAAAIFGFITTVAIDMVYKFLIRKEPIPLHSSMIFLTALSIIAILTQTGFLLFFMLTLKLGLYLYRKVWYLRNKIQMFPIISTLRLLALLFILFCWNSQFEIPEWGFLVILLIGEIIDRAEFFFESEATAPDRTMFTYQSKTVL